MSSLLSKEVKSPKINRTKKNTFTFEMSLGILLEYQNIQNKWTKLVIPIEYKVKNITVQRHPRAGLRQQMGNTFNADYANHFIHV